MSQIQKKSPLFSKNVRIGALIFIALCMIIVVGFLFFTLPQEENTTTIRGAANDDTPTVSATNLLETVEINRTVQYKGVDITVTRAMIASKFSDDRKTMGAYTVRVLAKTENKGKQIVGIEYASVVRLVLPDGEQVESKLVSIKPAEYPERPQEGFFDFPVSSHVPLSSLMLRFEDGTTIPFGKEA